MTTRLLCFVASFLVSVSVMALSEKKELQIGAKMHAEILQQTPAYPNPALQDYIQSLGQKLADVSERSELKWTFTLLDNPTINAFATPGGYVYLNSGLLAYLNSEEQLAAVLGHEVAHIAKRHASGRTNAGNASKILSTIAAVAAGLYTGSSTVAGVTQEVGSSFGAAVVSGYGRDQELEADEFGARYLKEIRYDPQAMIEVIAILKDQDSFARVKAKKSGKAARGYHGVFASHPRHDQRLQSLIANVGAQSSVVDVSPQHFRERMQNLKFGDKSRSSATLGARYYNRSLDFTLAFPTGWQVKSRGSIIEGREAQNKAVLQVRVKRADNGLNAQDLLHKFAPQTITEQGDSWRNGDAQGFSVKTKDGIRRAVVLYRGRAFLFTAKAKSSPLASLFDVLSYSSIKSFRGLNAQDRTLALAQKIQFVRVQAGQSYTELAAQSPLRQFAEEELRLLNGDYPAGTLTPNDIIKIVQ